MSARPAADGASGAGRASGAGATGGADGARREPLPTPPWMLTARPIVALLALAALAAAALTPGNEQVFVAVVAVLAACALYALHLGNLQRPDYTVRAAALMLGGFGAFALAGVGRLAWSVFGG